MTTFSKRMCVMKELIKACFKVHFNRKVKLYNIISALVHHDTVGNLTHLSKNYLYQNLQ